MFSESCFSGPMRHSAEIFPAVQKLLVHFNRKPKEIEHIYISIGPGSFTGLRIATAFAKAMNLANAVKIIAVDTLDVIAANAIDYISDFAYTTPDKKEKKVKDLNKIATILDAKRGQFFIAVYEKKQGRWEKTIADCLMTADEFINTCSSKSRLVWLLGEGLLYYKDKFKSDGTRFFDEKYWNPRAEKVHKLGWEKALSGQFADPLTLQPTYLRRPDIGVRE